VLALAGPASAIAAAAVTVAAAVTAAAAALMPALVKLAEVILKPFLDLKHGSGVVTGEPECRPGQLRSLLEEPDGVEPGDGGSGST
jgi:hypothetical protein